MHKALAEHQRGKKVETLSLNEIKHHRAIESKYATEDVAKNRKQKTLTLWKK